jgi:CSLREA domain-containing protein
MPTRRPARSVSASVVLTLIVASTIAATGAGGSIAAGSPGVIVDTTADSFDGSCGDGDCSLRDAIASAPRGGVVRVLPGFYVLSVAGAGGIAVGDLDISRSVTVEGVGETGSFIDATRLGARAFKVGTGGITAVLRDLTIFGVHDRSRAGGAVSVTRGALVLDHLTVSGGQTAAAGGLRVGPAGVARVLDSLFIGNRAVTGRGGAIRNDGTLSLQRSSFVGNRATDGGAIWNGADATLRATNVTASGNVATERGGALTANGAVRLRSVTVAGNRSGGIGGGIARPSTAGNVTTANHSIVAGNRAADRGAECSSALASGGFNVERRDSCAFDEATDVVRSDPQLGPLTANGGLTPTRALHAGSPAVNVGGACAPRDQRGAPRDRCDAGAYERVLCLGRAVDVVGTRSDDDLSGGRERDVFLGLGGDDVFQGSLDDDRACGGAGADHLIGGPGADRFAGGSGEDRLDGEQGHDRLDGGPGDDRCRGGTSRDRARRCERTPGVP